jgi:hypothetical protein
MVATTVMAMATVMATATTTRGKDVDDCKYDNSKDDGDDGISAGGGQGNIRLVAVLYCALVVWCLHTIGVIQICFGINLIWSKFYLACPDMPNIIYFSSYLFQVYTG